MSDIKKRYEECPESVSGHDFSGRRDEGVELMTVYVDNFRCPARIRGVRGRWSHMTASTPEELLEFATQKLALKPEWMQKQCEYGRCAVRDGVCRHFHFDVVETVRKTAISMGAVPVDLRRMGEITAGRMLYYRGID